MVKPMGMMSGCYFVGRGELLEWLNSLLQIQFTKIEQTSNGAAFCQVLDAIHPGTVTLGRVNYNATQGFETSQNFRVLHDAFHKNNITQYIDFVTLAKGKYMIALETLQWIHGYYEQTGPHPPYDAVARRRSTKCADPKVVQEDPDTRHSGFSTGKPTIPTKGKDPTIGQVGPRSVPKTQQSSSAKANAELEGLRRKLARIEEYCTEHTDDPAIQSIIALLQTE
jgi:RP/EB family microtubule-associated protein